MAKIKISNSPEREGYSFNIDEDYKRFELAKAAMQGMLSHTGIIDNAVKELKKIQNEFKLLKNCYDTINPYKK